MAEHVIDGPVAGRRPGILGIYYHGPAVAQFALPQVSQVMEGLYVLRSGPSLLTRRHLPKSHHGLKFSDHDFSDHFLVGVTNPDSEAAVRRVLEPEFTQWFLGEFGSGSSTFLTGTFEFTRGILFLAGGGHIYSSIEDLNAWASQAADLADRVAAWTESALA